MELIFLTKYKNFIKKFDHFLLVLLHNRADCGRPEAIKEESHLLTLAPVEEVNKLKRSNLPLFSWHLSATFYTSSRRTSNYSFRGHISLYNHINTSISVTTLN